jgi:thiamine biosynthesis lipoprotein
MKNKKLLFQIPFLLILIFGSIWIIRSQQNTVFQQNQGFVFGTIYHITYQSDEDLQTGIEAELKKVDNEFSMFNKQSTVSKINRGDKPELSDMFCELWNLSSRINKDTNGAFDVTVAPLVNAWGFGFKSGQMPDKAQVDSLKQYIGMDKLKLVNVGGKRYIEKANKNIMVDFSAIAKGFGSDVVARYLESKGIQNFMIEIGGEVVTKGMSPKRLPWKIGVTKPSDDKMQANNEIQTILNVTDKAMATSGNYRNFYYKNGKKYAHTIDPKSGYPVQHSLLSSTVLAKTCAEADAYATSFMVMGIDKAEKIIDRHNDLMGYLIYDDNGKNKVWYSKNLKKNVEE